MEQKCPHRNADRRNKIA